ncbi:hypothetical protein SAMN05421890_3946 [Ensifer adhaerens]|nr:hypothetical protein SAMN05421890_3946 [Ensifer adhaerens]
MEPDEAPLGNLDGSRWRSAVILLINQGGASAWLSGSFWPETGARAIDRRITRERFFPGDLARRLRLVSPLVGEMPREWQRGKATRKNVKLSRSGCVAKAPSGCRHLPHKGGDGWSTRTGHLNPQAERSGPLRTLPSPLAQPVPRKTRRGPREPEQPQHGVRQSGRERPWQPPSGAAWQRVMPKPAYRRRRTWR